MGSATNYLPDVWGYAQTFAPSGLDLKTDWHKPFVGQTLGDRTGLLFHAGADPSTEFEVVLCAELSDGTIHQGTPDSSNFRTIGPDILDLSLTLGRHTQVSYKLAWLDNASIVGQAIGLGARPCLSTTGFASSGLDLGESPVVIWPGSTIQTGEPTLIRSGGEIAKFTIVWGEDPKGLAIRALNSDFDSTYSQRLGFYQNLSLPPIEDAEVARTFVKACAIMKVNVETRTGKITSRWTTPDRWPHRHMWLWDSAFHSLGAQHLDPELGRDCIRSVLTKQRPSGFIPHTMAPDQRHDSKMTQPPLLAWATWELHTRNPSREFLAEVYPGLKEYIGWDLRNMDRLGTGLLQWQFPGPDSGMDNSPRFDKGPDFDAVDLNCFAVGECQVLGRVAAEIGLDDEISVWEKLNAKLKEKVNSRLWHGNDGFYYDRRRNGSWLRIKTVDDFLPLFSGIASEEGARTLVEDHLMNTEEFWTRFPVPSVALDEPSFELDMWRGPTWVNYNWLIISGLRRYGYDELARGLAEITVENIVRWRKERGSIYEFYDPFGVKPPQDLRRKGRVRRWPHEGIPVVSDYFWSSAIFVHILAERASA